MIVVFLFIFLFIFIFIIIIIFNNIVVGVQPNIEWIYSHSPFLAGLADKP